LRSISSNRESFSNSHLFSCRIIHQYVSYVMRVGLSRLRSFYNIYLQQDNRHTARLYGADFEPSATSPLPPTHHSPSPYEAKLRSAPPDYLTNTSNAQYQAPGYQPTYYFSYGNLTQPETLKRILDLKEEPVLRKAQIVGYSLANWAIILLSSTALLTILSLDTRTWCSRTTTSRILPTTKPLRTRRLPA
jgi:hypothetical protein